jgi:hypothetical protein
MDQNLISVFIGVISSLVATVIFILLAEFCRKVVIPWYGDQIYKGVRIDGKWKCTVMGGVDVPKEMPATLELAQVGESIKGTYAHTDHEGVTDVYDVRGVLRNMYLLALCTPKSKRSVDGLAFMFSVDTEGNDMVMRGAVICRGKGHTVGSYDQVKFVSRGS